MALFRLSILQVHGCPQLACLPRCPSLELLSLDDVNSDLVTHLVSSWCSVSDESKHVPALRLLMISNCSNLKRHSIFRSLQYLPSLETLTYHGSQEIESDNDDDNWEKEGIPWTSLTRLKSLGFEFGNDPQGDHLLKGLHNLTMLDTLTIYKKVPDEIDTQWTAHPNVRYLEIHDVNKVGCLNRVIQQLKKLQRLEFWLCGFDEDEWDKLPWEDLKALRRLEFWFCNFKSLPERCRHLPAIEDLEIKYCAELTHLPAWISHLTSLRIHHCPLLKDKCRKPLGSYWPLVREIPHLNMR